MFSFLKISIADSLVSRFPPSQVKLDLRWRTFIRNFLARITLIRIFPGQCFLLSLWRKHKRWWIAHHLYRRSLHAQKLACLVRNLQWLFLRSMRKCREMVKHLYPRRRKHGCFCFSNQLQGLFQLGLWWSIQFPNKNHRAALIPPWELRGSTLWKVRDRCLQVKLCLGFGVRKV